MDGTSKDIQVTCHHRTLWFPGGSLAFLSFHTVVIKANTQILSI